MRALSPSLPPSLYFLRPWLETTGNISLIRNWTQGFEQDLVPCLVPFWVVWRQWLTSLEYVPYARHQQTCIIWWHPENNPKSWVPYLHLADRIPRFRGLTWLTQSHPASKSWARLDLRVCLMLKRLLTAASSEGSLQALSHVWQCCCNRKLFGTLLCG